MSYWGLYVMLSLSGPRKVTEKSRPKTEQDRESAILFPTIINRQHIWNKHEYFLQTLGINRWAGNLSLQRSRVV